MDSSTPLQGGGSHFRLPFWLAIVGTAIAAAVIAAVSPFWPQHPFDFGGFISWMSLGIGFGLVFRVIRRRVFFVNRLSLHKAFSFDALFQAAIVVNPQLRYPDVECEFLASHTNTEPAAVSPWFLVREASAVAIPLALSAATASLAGRPLLAVVFTAAALAWLIYRALSAQLGFSGRMRYVIAVGLGVLASLVEGLCVVRAASLAYPDSPDWVSFSVYGVILAAFELSPVPFGLGILELAWITITAVLGPSVPGILVPFTYRLLRAAPVVLLMLFYLPRYKMAVSDLFDSRLPLVLSRTRRRAVVAERDSLGKRPQLSVVIPAYNESERLPRYLPEVVAFCSGLEGGAEIIVVDDGSKDGTPDYVADMAAAEPMIKLVRQNPNKGKGAAVRRGMLEAAGQYILFTDADGATPISECAKLLEASYAGADIVIGSRKAGGAAVHRERSALRSLIGSIFYRITNLLAVPGIEDTQCGFKLFTRDSARRIFPELRETGWAFDVEVLFLAQKFGLLIEELPVNWSAVEGSKIRPKDAFRMLVALLRIRHRASGLTTGPGAL